MGKMLRQAEETHGSGHALTGGTEAAAGDFDPERWWGYPPALALLMFVSGKPLQKD